MKKIISLVLVLTLVGAFFVGCGKKSETDKAGSGNDQSTTESSKESLKTITVGASSSPHAEILEQVKPILKDAGYELKIVVYDDYVQPNVALDTGDLDANYFQHQPYLDQYNEENGTKIVSAGAIHYEPFGVYPGKTKSISDLKKGAQIAVPSDASNEARALLLLEAQGIIKLKEGAGLNATKNDITENPNNVDIIEIEAAQLARSLQDVDLAVINGNYAIEAGLSVSKDAIATEDKDSLAAETYGNIVAVKEGNESRDDIKALLDALKSDTIKNYINDTYKGEVVPIF